MRTATESLPNSLLRRASYMDPWWNAIPRGKYPEGKGVSQTVITIGNSEPTTIEEQWSEITLQSQVLTLDSDADSSVCDNNYQEVGVGYDETTYGPRKFQLKGPVICATALTFNHNAGQFLTAYEQELSKRGRRSWSHEMENRYMYFAEKYVDGTKRGNANTAMSGTITNLPTSELTQGLLDDIASILIGQEATDPDANGFVSLGEMGPLFTLMIGMQQSRRILTNNADLRQDAQYAMPNELFKRVGASRVINNFRHWIVTHPPRFNVVNGKLVRVAPKIMTSATHGTKAADNPNYVNAEYEAAIVILPSVFEAEIVTQYTGTAWAKFNPVNYAGDWEFVRGAHRLGLDCEDPKEQLGRHYADFMYAPRPMFPEYGKVLIYRRCLAEDLLSTCAS